VPPRTEINPGSQRIQEKEPLEALNEPTAQGEQPNEPPDENKPGLQNPEGAVKPEVEQNMPGGQDKQELAIDGLYSPATQGIQKAKESAPEARL
jgi:hypothetical protein